MTYKEVFLFVAQCLTISYEEHNKRLIEKKLQTNTINWDFVVHFSTDHFVFPALYCNLKRVNFLHYLPNDLVVLMEHIADLNRERNKKIIIQAKEINQLLLANDIIPVFLKGTGNLLEDLYDDIAERMMGDIDFIVSRDKINKTATIFDKLEYSNHNAIHSKGSRHLPTLTHKNKIASVEIHSELLPKRYRDEFNYTSISKDKQLINGIYVMSFENQLSLSIIADQINDSGFLFKNISLRNAYDVFLLSKKFDTKIIFNGFNRLKKPLSCFLAASFYVFNKPYSLQYEPTKEIQDYMKSFNEGLENKTVRISRLTKVKREKKFKERLRYIKRVFFDKAFQSYVFRKLINKRFLKRKINQLFKLQSILL